MKKKISIILILIIVFNVILLKTRSEAFVSIKEAELVSTGYHEGYLRWGGMNLVFNYVVYNNVGAEYPAYCLNKDLDGVTGGNSYNVTTEELLTNVNVWRAIVNGYPYKTPAELGCFTKEEAYFATKQAVYCMLYDRDPNTYSANDERSERTLNALKNIVQTAKQSNEIKSSSDLTINQKNSKWQLDNINKKYISKTFSITSNASINEYTVAIENIKTEGTKLVDENNNEKAIFKYGEKFKIIIPIINITNAGEISIKVTGKVKTKPVLYGYSYNRNLQDYAIAGLMYEDGEGSLSLPYQKNETKIIINKKEEGTDKKLEGVKFSLLDEKKNVIYSELTTNKEGQIFIENLEPGEYFLQETKTAKGYEIYSQLIEVNVNLNEEVTVNVSNSKEEIIVDEEKTEKEIETVVKLPKTGM